MIKRGRRKDNKPSDSDSLPLLPFEEPSEEDPLDEPDDEPALDDAEPLRESSSSSSSIRVRYTLKASLSMLGGKSAPDR